MRAALDLAALPASSRPAHWRRLLAEARTELPPSSVVDGASAADALHRD